MTMERTCKPVAAETINKLTFKDKMRAYKRSPLSLILLLLVCGAALITMLTLLYLISYILVKGIPYITPDLFSFTYTSDNVSLMPALISTVVMTIIALVIALPLGIGAAIYSVEYAKRGNKLVQLVRITTETLSGIPSIVYGLFGYLCFVTALHWGYSLLAGAFTVAIMICRSSCAQRRRRSSRCRIPSVRAASGLARADCAQCFTSCCRAPCRAFCPA